MGPKLLRVFVALKLCGLVLRPGFGSAQGHDPDARGTLPHSAFDDDPIGIDPNAPPPDQKSAPIAPANASHTPEIDTHFGPRPRLGRAVPGEVLTAMPSVHETSHEVSVTLGPSLAQVDVHLRLENSVSEPAEALYRLAVPKHAVPIALRVCDHDACRDGLLDTHAENLSAYDAAVLARGPILPDGATRAPIAELRPVDDERGHALQLRAAPIQKEHDLDIWLSYAMEVTATGGVSRLWLPPRGMDPRVHAASVEFIAGDFVKPHADGLSLSPGQRVERPAWMGIELSAAMPQDAGKGIAMTSFPCGDETCTRVRAWAAPLAPQPTDLLIAIDGSPSMAGPARNRLPAAIAALLAIAPAGSTLRAQAFASRSQWLIQNAIPVEDVRLSAFGNLLGEQDLGSATRLESVAATLQRSGRQSHTGNHSHKRLLVILGDGGLTTSEQDPLADLQKKRWPVAMVNLSNDPARAGLADRLRSHDDLLIEAGAAGRVLERSQRDSALRERLLSLFVSQQNSVLTCSSKGQANHTLGRILAGDELVVTLKRPRGSKPMRCTASGLGSAREVPAVKLRKEAPLLANWARAQGAMGHAQTLSAVAREDLLRADNDWPSAPLFRPDKKSQRRRCDSRGPALRTSGINRDDAPILLAHPRICLKPPDVSASNATLGKGMPSDPLLEMLRDRVIPVARDCFRRDRAGRADYSVRAVFRFQLAEQEVIDARVEGDIDAQLRKCLLTAVDTLAVPRFTGVVKVSYPLKTLREELPVRLELSDMTAREVDQLISQ